MPVLDLLKAGWIIVTFLLVFFWVPSRLFGRRSTSAYIIWVAGNFVRMLICVAASILFLTGIKVLGAITVVLFLVAALGISWLRNHSWQVRGVIGSVQDKTLKLVRRAESQALTKFVDADAEPKPFSFHLPRFLQLNFWLALLENREVLIAAFVLVFVVSAALSWQIPIHQLRYEHVEQYGVLLRAREFALNLHTIGRPFVVPSALVTTSLISAVDLSQVTRYLSPLIGILLVLSLGLFVRICTRTGAGGIVAMYCLGAAALPPTSAPAEVATTLREKLLGLLDYTPSVTRPGPEFALGLILLLLGLSFLADWYRNGGRDSLIDVLCCLVLVSIVSQYLLVIFLVAGAAMLLGPWVGIIAVIVFCYGSAIFATVNSGVLPNDVFTVLPLVAGIAAGCFIAFVHSALAPLTGKRTDAVVLAVCLVVAAVWLRPHDLTAQFLEFESAAQQSRKISQSLPRQRWVVVAPVEQLPETFGFGGYEDLAGFVQKYQHQVNDPGFEFKDAPEDYLIYVEKVPFQMFASEPAMLSFATLTDSTYRNYRSPAGRASLESDAMQLCESYRASHSNVTIYYEDNELRIYRIHTPPKPPLALNRLDGRSLSFN